MGITHARDARNAPGEYLEGAEDGHGPGAGEHGWLDVLPLEVLVQVRQQALQHAVLKHVHAAHMEVFCLGVVVIVVVVDVVIVVVVVVVVVVAAAVVVVVVVVAAAVVVVVVVVVVGVAVAAAAAAAVVVVVVVVVVVWLSS